MRFIRTVLLSLFLCTSLYAAPQVTIESLNSELKQVETNNNLPYQSDIIASYQRSINWLNEYERATSASREYQKTIDNFQTTSEELKAQLARLKQETITADNTLSVAQIEQKVIETNSRLLDLSHEIQQKQEEFRSIGESMLQLPAQQSQSNKNLLDAEQRLQSIDANARTPLTNARLTEAQLETNYYKAHTNELVLKQLSAPNRQTLLELQINVLRTEYEKSESLLQLLREQSNELRLQKQRETELLAKELTELDLSFPDVIKDELMLNQSLSEKLAIQSERRDQIAQEQRKISSDIQSVRNVFNTLREQAQLFNASTTLSEMQRAQLSRLPKEPKPQQLDSEIAEERALQLSLQDSLEKLELFEEQFANFENALAGFEQLKASLGIVTEQDVSRLSAEQQNQYFVKKQEILALENGLLSRLLNNSGTSDEIFSIDQVKLFEQQIAIRHELLESLLNGSETLIVELAQLKVLNSQLVDALSEVKEASHRYLFWAADVPPLGVSFPIKVFADLNKILSLNTMSELVGAAKMMLRTPETLTLIFTASLFVIFGISSRRHYTSFLNRAASKVGRVTQDHFILTAKAIFWSIVVASPLPILWNTLSYGLQQAWPYPIAVALGSGVGATIPIMWAFMICASFAHPKGLFITHLGWSPERVHRAMRYYKLTVWAVVPLFIALISFDNYHDREFASTLGRTCFFLLCGVLVLMATNLRRAGIPLYLDSKGSGDNIFNDTLWTLLRYAPVVAALAAAFGYLMTAQALLGRLDVSVIIWFTLLIIYYVIRRWMLIQRRRIEFDRAKQKRAERLAQRARNEEDGNSSSAQVNNDNTLDIEEPVIDLDTISSQSLALVRSILTMLALISIIAIWSELHSAFSFLGNIHLWNVSTTVQGVESHQPITLSALFIAIIAFIITAQLIRNLPSLLELAILQHLDLAPGTGYAITTVTKYILMIIGCSVAFSLMGLDWSKLQWLIAALGVGIGIGLQEIFANFISGLILLFEKPIRINDMVTIRDLTGTVTKINTRATTILDWDRKEIIVPNKAFITEQFVNWSLSDTVTRIVNTIPAEIDADPALVTEILVDAAKKCSLILDTPPPEAFLVDIQQGIQLFELRVFAGEMGHRMPLRHELNQLILLGYKRHNLVLPFPPFQMRANPVSRSSVTRVPRKTGDS